MKRTSNDCIQDFLSIVYLFMLGSSFTSLLYGGGMLKAENFLTTTTITFVIGIICIILKVRLLK